jgi:hypothetical protein
MLLQLKLFFSLECPLFLIELNAWEDKLIFVNIIKFFRRLRKKILAKMVLVYKGILKEKK